MKETDERLYRSIFLIVGTAFALFVIISAIIPAVYPQGYFIHLDGAVNRIDHADLWSRIDPVSSILYELGDFGCHQMQARTILINGSEMPFCIRETFLFLGASAGFILLPFFIKKMELPCRTRFLIGAAMILLTLAEWIFENRTSIDVPTVRAIVSLISGAGVPLVLFSLLEWEIGMLEKRPSM